MGKPLIMCTCMTRPKWPSGVIPERKQHQKIWCSRIGIAQKRPQGPKTAASDVGGAEIDKPADGNGGPG